MTCASRALDGGWRMRADPHDVGRAERWGIAPRDDGWSAAKVPGTMQGQFGMDAPPVCWYRRSLSRDECARETASRVWLRFDAVATDTTVWVDGVEVGRHVGDWTPFRFDVTDALRDGAREYEIVARVDRIAPGKETWIDGAPVQGGHVTKGFHDVLSVHKGGIWQPVHLDVTGDVVTECDGIGVLADVRTGAVRFDVEFARNVGGGAVEFDVRDPDGSPVAAVRVDLADGADSASGCATVPHPVAWEPDAPRLYALDVRVLDARGRLSQRASIRFGMRRVEIGGLDGRQILLNGRPVFLSGVLDWGHEPRHIAPAPTRDELRERFATLRRMGFNLVCICMWYPPRHYYEVADETGMMLWQEHPVWKSPMGDEHVAEYQRQFTKFFRRDRNHASVVMVSGSCEHERFNPKLAAWWWGRVRALMPDRIAQIQTAFFAWTDLTKTDAYDEHTYDSSGRWVRYLEDLQSDLRALPPKPFVMGESILYVNWPDAEALRSQRDRDGGRPWWLPLGLDAAAQFEDDVARRFGAETLERFKRQAHRFHLEGRKFQFELFRSYANHAGLVMNHLRDVPACRCGFEDELGRWYFTPEETRPWLCDAPLLLRTPEHLRGARGGWLDVEFGVANFSAADIDADVAIVVDGAQRSPPIARLRAARGCVAWVPARIELPDVDRPTPVEVQAGARGLVANRWRLWNLPAATARIERCVRQDGRGVPMPEPALEFEDKKYSSGWGSPVRSWSPLVPDPELLAPELPVWRPGTPLPAGTRCVVAHALTQPLVDVLVGGTRVVLLVSRAPGNPPVKYVNIWGQLPLIVERGPFESGDSAWIADLLDHDLSRRSVRAIPVGELGLDEALDPLVRLVHCHDIVDRPRLFDFVTTAKVGTGTLVISAADSTTPAGQYLIERLLRFAVRDDADSAGRLDEDLVRSWAIDV